MSHGSCRNPIPPDGSEDADISDSMAHKRMERPWRNAQDVQTTATIIGVVNVISAALGILASVISLLA